MAQAETAKEDHKFLFSTMNNKQRVDPVMATSFIPYARDDYNKQEKIQVQPSPCSDRRMKKIVKGVEETIFHRKFRELSNLLDSVDDDNWQLFEGKKKACYFKHDRRTKRRSGYRGVSRNGASWQVLMMVNNVKTYIGCYDTEEEGALVYDIISILFKQRKARTNLSYSKSKLLELLANYDQDSKHFVGLVPEKFITELQLSVQD